MEMFTKDRDAHDIAVLVCGIIELFAAFIVTEVLKVYLINRFKLL